jgi:vacuolar protein sorting-associated protein 13A/C
VAAAGEPGYLNKMFSKIIDNIQLSVNNLHLRLEGGQQVQLQYRVDCGSSEEEEEEGEEGKVVSSPSKPFACGFCLSTLTAYTTNNNWEKHFYDRTVEQSLEMRKKVDLSNMSLYW